MSTIPLPSAYRLGAMSNKESLIGRRKHIKQRGKSLVPSDSTATKAMKARQKALKGE